MKQFAVFILAGIACSVAAMVLAATMHAHVAQLFNPFLPLYIALYDPVEGETSFAHAVIFGLNMTVFFFFGCLSFLAKRIRIAGYALITLVALFVILDLSWFLLWH